MVQPQHHVSMRKYKTWFQLLIVVFADFVLKFALETATLRELRNLLAHCNKRSWYRVMATFKKIKLPIPASPLRIIRDQLLKFKPSQISHKKPLQ